MDIRVSAKSASLARARAISVLLAAASYLTGIRISGGVNPARVTCQHSAEQLDRMKGRLEVKSHRNRVFYWQIRQ
jgi:hypothetical protein